MQIIVFETLCNWCILVEINHIHVLCHTHSHCLRN